MQEQFFVLTIAILNFAIGGIVSPVQRCGGVGTAVQLRISECEGRCQFQAGMRYDCEEDFFPSSPAQSLSLLVQICYLGNCWDILDAELAGSSVQPGNMYTARYSIVPNDVLSGEAIIVQGMLYNTQTGVREICLRFEADIL